jgi:6-phosphogluconolactonase (cycloisomerase 2 family)
MKRTIRIATIGGLAALGASATGLLAGPAAASPTHAPTARTAHEFGSDVAGAVFVQTDNLQGNTIVAYARSADGTLTQTGVYATGGLGGQLTGSVVDHTASQGALAYDARTRLLYAVNAGSNTITVFSVHGHHLTRIQIIDSGGTFPVSIAVHRGQVFVLNARGGGSIQGYARLGDLLVKVPSWNRSLGFNPNAAPEFTSTPGQIAFTPDGSKLIVTTKGDGQSIEVFPVDRFGPAAQPVITPDPGNVPFAVAFDRHRHLVVVEAGPSAVATFVVNHDATLSLIGRTPTGQAATCWVTVTGRHVYASNAGSADLSGYNDHRGELTSLGTTATDPGTVDSAASPDGRFLYVQAGASGIVDEFKIDHSGALTSVGSQTVPAAAGGEGIVVT